METTLSEVAEPQVEARRRKGPPPSGGQRLAPRPRRYFVFGGEDKPSGGFNDFQGAYNALSIAVTQMNLLTRGRPLSWAHIVDMDAPGGPEIIQRKSGWGGG